MRPLNISEMTQIATLRNWPTIAGLELLSRRELLHQAEVFDDGSLHPAWLIADSSLRNFQARRLDGMPWNGIGGAKAKSLPDSYSSWPIGAADIGQRPFVILCEGQPDFCAALGLIHFEVGKHAELYAPVCMTGATNNIAVEAYPSFVGKHVRIVGQNDDAGMKAVGRWVDQLYTAGANKVDALVFAKSAANMPGGRPAKDLADQLALFDPISGNTRFFVDMLRRGPA